MGDLKSELLSAFRKPHVRAQLRGEGGGRGKGVPMTPPFLIIFFNALGKGRDMIIWWVPCFTHGDPPPLPPSFKISRLGPWRRPRSFTTSSVAVKLHQASYLTESASLVPNWILLVTWRVSCSLMVLSVACVSDVNYGFLFASTCVEIHSQS